MQAIETEKQNIAHIHQLRIEAEALVVKSREGFQAAQRKAASLRNALEPKYGSAVATPVKRPNWVGHTRRVSSMSQLDMPSSLEEQFKETVGGATASESESDANREEASDDGTLSGGIGSGLRDHAMPFIASGNHFPDNNVLTTLQS